MSMTLEEQTKKLITVIVKVLNDNKDLSEAMVPALAAIMTSVVDAHVDHNSEEKDRYLYCMRGYNVDGKPTVVSVDYDILPLLQHLEECGLDKFDPRYIIALMKHPEIVEEVSSELH